MLAGGSHGGPTADYFEGTEAERAAFEAGIKLGSISHRYVGAPVPPENAEWLARTIEEGTRVQPFVENVRVRIDDERRGGRGAFPHRPLTGEMLDTEVHLHTGEAAALAALRYERELRYPLMRIREIRRAAPRG
ncbi:MAG: dihydroneopterin aldolase family protein [Candidatus Thermoplasmatota archaeon]|nr:dihydroneopterin aldolase family protein [Candidatus Thermoplasmatota archaeon]